MTVGERIRRRRKELRLSVDYIADKLGKNRATVYRYESDEIEDMPINVVAEIAQALKVDPAYLMGWKDVKEDIQIANEYRFYPTSVSAGVPLEIDGMTKNDIEKITIPDYVMGKWAGHKDIFVTKVFGDSMNNIMPDNSLIAVKPITLSELKDGDIVVYSNDHEYSVKRFYEFDDKLVFKPDSTDMRFTDDEIPLDNTSNLNIHGKVVLYIVEMD